MWHFYKKKKTFFFFYPVAKTSFHRDVQWWLIRHTVCILLSAVSGVSADMANALPDMSMNKPTLPVHTDPAPPPIMTVYITGVALACKRKTGICLTDMLVKDFRICPGKPSRDITAVWPPSFRPTAGRPVQILSACTLPEPGLVLISISYQIFWPLTSQLIK